MSTIANNLDDCLGARIRAEREARGWSLTDLAGRADVSRAMIHKVEHGESSPTATLLGRLCGAFGISVSTLIARAEGGGGRLLRKADQPVWTDPETGYLRRHVSPMGITPIDLVEVSLPPGAVVSYSAAAFAFLQQTIWVNEGRLTFVEGTMVHQLEAGDCLVLGPPADCQFRNDTVMNCRYVVIILKSA